MRVNRRDGVSLHVAQDRRLWRRWWWAIVEPGQDTIEGRAWTRVGAIAQGMAARSSWLATRRLP